MMRETWEEQMSHRLWRNVGDIFGLGRLSSFLFLNQIFKYAGY